jgi:hypothetical protein
VFEALPDDEADSEEAILGAAPETLGRGDANGRQRQSIIHPSRLHSHRPESALRSQAHRSGEMGHTQ